MKVGSRREPIVYPSKYIATTGSREPAIEATKCIYPIGSREPAVATAIKQKITVGSPEPTHPKTKETTAVGFRQATSFSS